MRGAQTLGNISELIEVAPTAISVVQLGDDGLSHLYDNQAASKLFTLSPEVRSSATTPPGSSVRLDTILLEYCRESTARAAPIRFEFQANYTGQLSWYTAAAFPIRSMPSGQLPIIVAVTGWGSEQDKKNSAEAGCNLHLTKPIDLGEVERLVNPP